MTIKTFATAALASLRSWQTVINQLIVLLLGWSAYWFCFTPLGQLVLADNLAALQMLQVVYWIDIAMSVLWLVFAGLRSVLPALLALLEAVPAYLLGYSTVATWALGVGVAALLLFAIGTAIGTDQLRRVEHG